MSAGNGQQARAKTGEINIGGQILKAHRVAWTLTFGKIPDELCCCHHCDNPECCNPYHLFVGTPSDNIADMVAKKRHAHGNKHGNSKLTEDDVLEIRILLKNGLKQIEIAELYEIKPACISHISTGHRWGWLEDERNSE